MPAGRCFAKMSALRLHPALAVLFGRGSAVIGIDSVMVLYTLAGTLSLHPTRDVAQFTFLPRGRRVLFLQGNATVERLGDGPEPL